MARSKVGIVSNDEAPTMATAFGYNLVFVGIFFCEFN